MIELKKKDYILMLFVVFQFVFCTFELYFQKFAAKEQDNRMNIIDLQLLQNHEDEQYTSLHGQRDTCKNYCCGR